MGGNDSSPQHEPLNWPKSRDSQADFTDYNVPPGSPTSQDIFQEIDETINYTYAHLIDNLYPPDESKSSYWTARSQVNSQIPSEWSKQSPPLQKDAQNYVAAHLRGGGQPYIPTRSPNLEYFHAGERRENIASSTRQIPEESLSTNEESATNYTEDSYDDEDNVSTSHYDSRQRGLMDKDNNIDKYAELPPPVPSKSPLRDTPQARYSIFPVPYSHNWRRSPSSPKCHPTPSSSKAKGKRAVRTEDETEDDDVLVDTLMDHALLSQSPGSTLEQQRWVSSSNSSVASSSPRLHNQASLRQNRGSRAAHLQRPGGQSEEATQYALVGANKVVDGRPRDKDIERAERIQLFRTGKKITEAYADDLHASQFGNANEAPSRRPDSEYEHFFDTDRATSYFAPSVREERIREHGHGTRLESIAELGDDVEKVRNNIRNAFLARAVEIRKSDQRQRENINKNIRMSQKEKMKAFHDLEVGTTMRYRRAMEETGYDQVDIKEAIREVIDITSGTNGSNLAGGTTATLTQPSQPPAVPASQFSKSSQSSQRSSKKSSFGKALWKGVKYALAVPSDPELKSYSRSHPPMIALGSMGPVGPNNIVSMWYTKDNNPEETKRDSKRNSKEIRRSLSIHKPSQGVGKQPLRDIQKSMKAPSKPSTVVTQLPTQSVMYGEGESSRHVPTVLEQSDYFETYRSQQSGQEGFLGTQPERPPPTYLQRRQESTDMVDVRRASSNVTGWPSQHLSDYSQVSWL